jgi:hypothetical protein
MMLPTHVLAGMVLALPFAFADPSSTGVALAAGALGGMFPDLDLYVAHRRSLHYPVYYGALAVAAVASVVLVPSAVTVAAASFLVGAAVHCLGDVAGGGLELRPWEATSDRGVYDHYRDRWIAPRRWIRYDGSPGDLLVSIVLGGTLLVAVDGIPRQVVMGALAVAVTYTVVRRSLPSIAETLVDVVLEPYLPATVFSAVPERYREPDADEERDARPSAAASH